MKKVLLSLFLVAAMLLSVTGCKNESTSETNTTKIKSISIVDNMKDEAKEELEDMFNYNSSGYTSVKSESVFDNEQMNENMITTGVFKFEEDGKTYYYFRGNVQNNYLKFGKNADGKEMFWRIIRSNEDNTIKIQYYGTSTEYEDKAIGTTTYHSNTGKITDVNYSTSNIKTMVESWYEKNIKETGYDKYVEEKVFTCDTSYKMEKLEETFGSVYRTRYNYLITDKASPSLKNIENAENLKLKVGIITADEALMAGANKVVNSDATNAPYIKNSKIYWTMSPEHYYAPSPNKDNGTGYVLLVSSSLTAAPTNTERSVIPVINLTTEALKNVTGTGTKSDPYTIN